MSARLGVAPVLHAVAAIEQAVAESQSETAEEVAERMRALLRCVPAERLWLNPDCEFWETPRWDEEEPLPR